MILVRTDHPCLRVGHHNSHPNLCIIEVKVHLGPRVGFGGLMTNN
jgi:hypothetical protein